ncbi:MAG TPA: SpoIIE family protein phosphatase [Solirubrobacteraceae bacterium]|jgi:anti-sigma regulatory factor (Ser/Thr protein kinase)/PAS domain-containing protein|nr:SpoIIE family protein phosphatase [Solirubrobacteraceae bacterium]
MSQFAVMAALNGVIASAYLVMATYLAPRFGLPAPARIAAIAFFTACGLTHVELLVHTLANQPAWMTSGHMFAIHGVQAAVDWGFILVAVRHLDIRFTRRMPRAAERLADALHLVSAGAWEWDPRRDRLFVSAEFAEMCGADPDWQPSAAEFVERCVHPDDRGRLMRAVASRRDGGGEGDGRPGEVEYRVVRPDGEVRTLLTRFEPSPRRGRRGRRGTVVGAAQDVTERRSADDERERARVAEERADREQRIAETLQRSLLPARLPDAQPLELAARYLPARAGAEVGGDWYDVLPLPNGHVGLVMGDVVGRGIPAAALVGKLRNGLRAYAYEGHSPARTLDRLNRLLDGHTEMATVLFALYEPETSRLSWVSAGHPPPLVRRADGTREFLEGGRSVPLGALGQTTYAAAEGTLEPGAMLLLYTDGLVERPGEPILAALERLREAARQNGSADALCEATVSALLPGGAGADDVAVLAAHVPAGTARCRMRLPAEAAALSDLRRRLRRWLQAQGVERPLRERVTLCTSEAASNAVEHAYGLERATFSVDAAVDGDALTVAIADGGRWREPRGRDGGRGTLLMRASADSVDVARSPEGTTVTLGWRLAGRRA